MATSATIRKPLGIRATAKERAIIRRAAEREGRSLNSYVMHVVLEAAEKKPHRKKSQKEVLAAVRRAQKIMEPYVIPGRSMADELIAERRAEAARE